MRMHYDETSDALLVTFRDGVYEDSEEIFEGFVVDFDKEGRPLGLDIYTEASKFVDIAALKRNVRLEDDSPPLRRVDSRPKAEASMMIADKPSKPKKRRR
jgi:uncharacterized protein YuzE